MTDARLAVTQSELEAAIREYLKGLGGSIQADGNRWYVNLPAHVDVGFSDSSEFEIALLSDENAENESVALLTPESEFTQKILEEAADMAMIGRVELTSDVVNGDYQHPAWIAESNAEVTDVKFNPYYDKVAICAFVRVGVETVSKFQTQFLEAVSVDLDSEEHLPKITDLLIGEYFRPKAAPPNELSEGSEISVSAEKLAAVINVGQKLAVEEVQGDIDDLRQSASKSATSEFEEYQQLQEQRITELQSEITSISDRIQNVATDVEDAKSQHQRVEVLEKRRELKEAKSKAEEELTEILGEKERGYSQRKHEIYDRHAIEVKTTPVAITLVTYERGEIEYTVRESGKTTSVRAPYAIGVGVTDEVSCNTCHATLTETNPVSIVPDGVGCHSCK
ncbi:hypothetical protein [Haladaptatus sp. NG-SE-30]